MIAIDFQNTLACRLQSNIAAAAQATEYPPVSTRHAPMKSPLPAAQRLLVHLSGLGLFTALACQPADAVNLAPEGTGIIGYNDDPNYRDLGTPLAHAGSVAAINDENPNSRVDTFSGRTVGSSSYVGVVWPAVRSEKIKSMVLTLATFFDGGWFGVNGAGPGSGGTLTAAHLAEPTVQVTTDGGVTWATVPHTSNYLTTMTGHIIGGPVVNPTRKTTTFTLVTPINDIDGIRLIGRDGGQADVGFLGVFELEIIPLPANDLDDDAMADDWEIANGLDPNVNDAALDFDSDGLTNLDEFNHDTDPQNPDTDGDGLLDGAEVYTHLTDPKVADTDGDGLSDGAEVLIHLTNPRLADSDGDGLSDAAEITVYLTNPLLADTDGDGYPDGIEVRLGSNPAAADSRPANVAPLGTAILGVHDFIDENPGTPRANAGIAAHVNDADLGSRVDTFGAPPAASYVGILWPSPRPNPVALLKLSLAVFFDGGWFGPNGISPGAGGFLIDPDSLLEPTVQVTTDGGTTWTTVGHTSNYLALYNNHPLPRVAFAPPTSAEAVFVLDPPQPGINGVRIIGDNGGIADGNGFLGVFELDVRESPPSPIANLAILGSGILGTNDDIDADSGLIGANGTPAALNDGLAATRVDTFNVSSSDPYSFVGVLWPSPRTEPIATVTTTFAVFFDGGWFGPNGVSPGAGGTLATADLIEPTLQITTDSLTWETVPHSSNYHEVLEDFALPAVDFGPPTAPTVTFALDVPRTGLTGIRLIGENAGPADGNGFLGVFEFAVMAAPPSSDLDTDGDGQSDAAEAIAGTNPADPKDFLRIVSITPATVAGGPISLAWTSVPGKAYLVQQSTTLATASWAPAIVAAVPAAVAPATTTTITMETPAASPNGLHYRILVDTTP